MIAAVGPRRLLAIALRNQRSFAGGSIITLALNSTAFVINTVISILISRRLGPEQSGYVVWFITGTTAIALFADVLGIYYSNAYLVARGDPGVDIETIRGTIFAYGAMMGILVGLAVGFLHFFRELAFPGYRDPMWRVMIFCNVLSLVLIGQARGLFLGQGSFILLGGTVLVRSVAYAASAAVLMYGFGCRMGRQLAIAQVIATGSCAAFFMLRVLSRGAKPPRLSYLKTCFRMGWRGAGINWLSFLHQRTDQYLINMFFGRTAVGLYAVAVTVGEITTQGPGLIGMVLFPLTARDPDQRSAALATLRRTAVLMCGIGLLMIPVGVFAPVIIQRLYGPTFAPAVALLRWFLPAVVFLSGLQMINQHVAGMGYPVFQLVAMLIGLALNIALNLILLPRLSVVGASIAVSISYCVWLLMVTGYLVHKIREHVVRPATMVQ